MPSGRSAKRRGTNFERRVRKYLESKENCLVMRSAGSFGCFDLLAIRPASDVRSRLSMLGLSHEQIEQVMDIFRECVLGIQCKTNGRLCKVERASMIELAGKYNIKPLLVWRDGRKLRWEEVE